MLLAINDVHETGGIVKLYRWVRAKRLTHSYVKFFMYKSEIVFAFIEYLQELTTIATVAWYPLSDLSKMIGNHDKTGMSVSWSGMFSWTS